MKTPKEMITEFVDQMYEDNQQQIESVAMPEGTQEYLQELLDNKELDKVLFVLKLSYIMGMQTGYAAKELEGKLPHIPSQGPLQA